MGKLHYQWWPDWFNTVYSTRPLPHGIHCAGDQSKPTHQRSGRGEVGWKVQAPSKAFGGSAEEPAAFQTVESLPCCKGFLLFSFLLRWLWARLWCAEDSGRMALNSCPTTRAVLNLSQVLWPASGDNCSNARVLSSRLLCSQKIRWTLIY